MKKILFTILCAFASFLTIYGQNNCQQIVSNNADGLLVITRNSNGVSKSGFIDLKGEIKIQPVYDEAYPFSNGLALVKLNDKYGYIDRDGKEIVKFLFDNACSFAEGLAAVKKNGKYGYIDKSGSEIIPFQFDKAFNFSEGLAVIEIYTKDLKISENQFGYVDKTGRTVIAAKFERATDFRNGIAEVIDSIFGLETYIDKTGKTISRKFNTTNNGGLGATRSLIKVRIETNPIGANIYMIPKRDLDIDASLTTKDEDSLYEYKVPSGSTPTEFLSKQKVYTVLLIRGGVRKLVNLDVRADGSNIVNVSFP